MDERNQTPYEADAAWELFYEELEPEKRLEHLNAAISASGAGGANRFRKQLFEERYPSGDSDRFLMQCMLLLSAYENYGKLFSGFQRDLREAAAVFHLDAPLSGQEREALYWELRNTAKRYLSTCCTEGYGRKLLGLKNASPEEKRARACGEIWKMSRGVAQVSGKEAQLEILCRAFDDERLLFSGAHKK